MTYSSKNGDDHIALFSVVISELRKKSGLRGNAIRIDYRCSSELKPQRQVMVSRMSLSVRFTSLAAI